MGILIPIGCFLLVFYSLYFPLPSKKRPIVFYSTHNREDLRLITLKTIRSAKRCINIHTYALTDPSIISLLKTTAERGVDIHITYHEKTTPKLKQFESSHLHLHPTKGRGLMHAKWLTVDDRWVYLGTANLTTSSLMMHDNLLLGLDAPDFAKALAHCPSTYQGKIGNQNLSFFLLPQKEGLPHLMSSLDKAERRVAIALFTLTHPDLVEKLIDLHQRGIQVDLTLDQTAARGASKKALECLLEAGVPLKRSQGLQLFHHKWALIDNQIFILGSANWTKAAFTKNKDFILFLSPLTNKQTNYLNKSINIIKKDSVNCN